MLKLPVDNAKNPRPIKNKKDIRLIKNPVELSSFILQNQVKKTWVKTWVNVNFFSTDPIELIDLNKSLSYLNSFENPNFYRISLVMFQGNTLFSLHNRTIYFEKPLGLTCLEQPSLHYALETFQGINAQFAIVADRAKILLNRHVLVNDFLAEKVRCYPPSMSIGDCSSAFNIYPTSVHFAEVPLEEGLAVQKKMDK